MRADSATRRGAQARGGGGGQNLARQQGDEMRADWPIGRGEEAMGGGGGDNTGRGDDVTRP